MIVTIILILLCLALLGFGICALLLASEERKSRKEAEERAKATEKEKIEIVEKINKVKNEKEKINTGNGRADFEQSIDMLRKFSNGACEEE